MRCTMPADRAIDAAERTIGVDICAAPPASCQFVSAVEYTAVNTVTRKGSVDFGSGMKAGDDRSYCP